MQAQPDSGGLGAYQFVFAGLPENVEYYVARVQPGKVLFEMEGVDEVTAREAFRLAGSKLSVSTSFVKRQVR